MSGIRTSDGLFDAWMTVIYALATHFLEELDFMLSLMFIRPTDIDKSTALRQLASVCRAPDFQGSVLIQDATGAYMVHSVKDVAEGIMPSDERMSID